MGDVREGRLREQRSHPSRTDRGRQGPGGALPHSIVTPVSLHSTQPEIRRASHMLFYLVLRLYITLREAILPHGAPQWTIQGLQGHIITLREFRVAMTYTSRALLSNKLLSLRV